MGKLRTYLWGARRLAGSGLLKLVMKRRSAAAKQKTAGLRIPNANKLASVMHPRRLRMVITAITDCCPVMKVYRLEAADGREIPYFIAGQYVPIFTEIDGGEIERPYAITSSPLEALHGYYEIAIKRAVGGYVSNYILDNWKVGDEVLIGAPLGTETYSPIRDRKDVVVLTGGSGVTPYHSMARAVADGTLDCNMTLIYGCNTINDIAFLDEWEHLKQVSGGRFKYVLIVAQEDMEGAERGFITREIIDKYCDIHNASVFIGGNPGLMKFLHEQLDPMNLEPRYLHWGLNSDAIPTVEGEEKEREFTLTVHIQGKTVRIPAKRGETVIRALERAKLSPAVSCRSGVCGFCRSYLISGDVEVVGPNSGQRKRDRELGFIHPCCTFPCSDLEITVNKA